MRGTLLLIGPLPIAGDQIGGAKVAFQRMVADLADRDDVAIAIVNLSRPLLGRGGVMRALLGARTTLAAIGRIAHRGRAADVWVLNCASGGVFTLFPLVLSLAAILRRPLVLRVFGGDMDERHDAAGAVGRRLFRATATRCRAVVLETGALTERFASLGNVRRLPNTRSLPAPGQPSERCSRLIFLGQIRDEKGVGVLLEAMEGTTSGCRVDCYGSPVDEALLERIARHPDVAYRGELDPADIGDALRRYDALVLPTFWAGEGLPGVVVEAFQCGLPVLASRWRQVPELVVHEANGLLVPPRSADALRAALERLVTDERLYARLCAGARDSGEALRSDVWHARLVDWCLP